MAKMLMDKRTYLDISEKTGASTATISRVNRSLNYGNDGYDMVFKRMEEKKSRTVLWIRRTNKRQEDLNRNRIEYTKENPRNCAMR